MAFTLQSIIHIGGNSADAHNMKARLAFVAVCMGMVYTNIFRPIMEDGNRPNQKEKDKNRWEKKLKRAKTGRSNQQLITI